MTQSAPLAGVRIIESSMLGPGAITTHLAELGADVIKVEPPNGDYIRQMSWPIIEGDSLLHLHISRGKRSIVLDLKSDAGKDIFRELVAGADAVVEAMRPGALDRLGLGFEALKAINPAIVFVSISGYGATGPYRTLPSHGIAYDVWAGIVQPEIDELGHPVMPEHVSIGINAGPLYGALAICAGIIAARESGEGRAFEVAQSDAAASIDWFRSETWKAYERPEDEVTGNASDGYARRPPGTAGMRQGVRYQFYVSADGHVLFMASEREFWKNFCAGVGQPELFERFPGSQYADHELGNRELQAILRDIFLTKTTAEWVSFGDEVNVPIGPANTPKTIADDPQFQDRLPWLPASEHGTDMLPSPIKPVGAPPLPPPRKAPTVGQHSDEVLREVLGYDDATIAALREAGTTR